MTNPSKRSKRSSIYVPITGGNALRRKDVGTPKKMPESAHANSGAELQPGRLERGEAGIDSWARDRLTWTLLNSIELLKSELVEAVLKR